MRAKKIYKKKNKRKESVLRKLRTSAYVSMKKRATGLSLRENNIR